MMLRSKLTPVLPPRATMARSDELRRGMVGRVVLRGRLKCGGPGGKPGPCPENNPPAESPATDRQSADKPDRSIASPERVKETADLLKSHADSVLAKLSSSQKGALSDYSTDAAQDVNAALRKGGLPADRDQRDIVKHLDTMFEQTPSLKEPVTTYRGLAFSDAAQAKAFADKIEASQGGTVTLPGFTSTSIDPQVAQKFLEKQEGDGSHGVMFQIQARHGVYLEGQSVQSNQSKGEHELLLPREGKFKVAGKRTAEVGGKSMTVYQLEQL